MLPRNFEATFRPYGRAPYCESAGRGHCTVQVQFTSQTDWGWILWFHGDSSEKTHLALNSKHRRGYKKAKRVLGPVVALWADSEYKYTMDLQDFLIATLGKYGAKK